MSNVKGTYQFHHPPWFVFRNVNQYVHLADFPEILMLWVTNNMAIMVQCQGIASLSFAWNWASTLTLSIIQMYDTQPYQFALLLITIHSLAKFSPLSQLTHHPPTNPPTHPNHERTHPPIHSLTRPLSSFLPPLSVSPPSPLSLPSVQMPLPPRAAKLSLLNFLSLSRDLQKPTRFSVGGGGSSRMFPCSPDAGGGGG